MFNYIISCFFIYIASHYTFGAEGSESSVKKTICLNMIVKNESHVIKRCLKSVLPFIDYWVIVDTGSTDGTQQLIKEYMFENHVPGELHERPWVNFGYNRQEALMLAKSKADYLFFMDADDVITYPEDYKLPDFIFDFYLIPAKAEGMQYQLISFVKSSLDLHWRDPIHEYIEAPDAKTAGVLTRLEYVYVHDGARSKDSEVINKDIKLLEDCVAKDPENPRYVMYLAQAHLSKKNYAEALKFFKQRSEMGGNEQEVFWALLLIGHMHGELNSPSEMIKASYTKANEYRPSRTEPIYYLANLASKEGNFQQAYDIAKSGLHQPKTEDLLQQEFAASDGIMYEFANAAFKLGKYKECLKACNRLIKKNQLPQPFTVSIRNLRQNASEKLHEHEVHRILEKYE